MTDYIAYYKNEPISIYDYKDLIESNPDIKKEQIYCICGEPIYYKNESKPFKRCNSNCIIQTICHFSHHKKSNCNINKIFKTSVNHGIINTGIMRTEIEKKMDRLNNIVKAYLTGIKIENELKSKLYTTIKYMTNARLKEINLSDDLLKIKDNFYYPITFRDLMNTKINHMKRYKLIDIYPKEKNNGISSSIMNYICGNDDIYKLYIRNLSLIIVYYSRCINYSYKDSINMIITDCIYQLEEKIKINPDNDLAIKYLNLFKESL